MVAAGIVPRLQDSNKKRNDMKINSEDLNKVEEKLAFIERETGVVGIARNEVSNCGGSCYGSCASTCFAACMWQCGGIGKSHPMNPKTRATGL